MATVDIFRSKPPCDGSSDSHSHNSSSRSGSEPNNAPHRHHLEDAFIRTNTSDSRENGALSSGGGVQGGKVVSDDAAAAAVTSAEIDAAYAALPALVKPPTLMGGGAASVVAAVAAEQSISLSCNSRGRRMGGLVVKRKVGSLSTSPSSSTGLTQQPSSSAESTTTTVCATALSSQYGFSQHAGSMPKNSQHADGDSNGNDDSSANAFLFDTKHSGGIEGFLGSLGGGAMRLGDKRRLLPPQHENTNDYYFLAPRSALVVPPSSSSVAGHTNANDISSGGNECQRDQKPFQHNRGEGEGLHNRSGGNSQMFHIVDEGLVVIKLRTDADTEGGDAVAMKEGAKRVAAPHKRTPDEHDDRKGLADDGDNIRRGADQAERGAEEKEEEGSLCPSTMMLGLNIGLSEDAIGCITEEERHPPATLDDAFDWEVDPSLFVASRFQKFKMRQRGNHGLPDDSSQPCSGEKQHQQQKPGRRGE